jgi:hypothetical protein
MAYDIDITGLVTLQTPSNLTFYVSGVVPTARNFTVYNITIAVNYTTDIVVNFIQNMTNGGRYDTFPKVIDVNVSNRGTSPAVYVDFHLQIYKEEQDPPVRIKCWDFEECFIITWDTFSWDGDQLTWYWTEKRSFSPTHSYHSQPDYAATYEANSHDSLILHDCYTIPTTYDGWAVTSAYLNFSQWVEGEYDGTNPIDFGNVYIDNATGTYQIGGPYYDTDGAWEYEEIDISAYIGDCVRFNFTWFSDDYFNYEGWYIDDVCIDISLGALQPLIFQGYKYSNFTANDTHTIRFPIEFEVPEEGTYFFQVYSDYDDCKADDTYPQYADEINYTIWFGDVCDGEITDIIVPGSVQMPNHPAGEEYNFVHVPINVTVRNNGTLAQEIPVRVSARHKIENVVKFDDFESSNLKYFYEGGIWEWLIANLTEINDYKFFSPFKSMTTYIPGLGTFDDTGHSYLIWKGQLDARNMSRDADITFQLSYNLANAAVVPMFVQDETQWRWLVNTTFVANYDYGFADSFWWHDGSQGWAEFSVNDYIATHDLYWEDNDNWGGYGDATGFFDLCWKAYEMNGAERFLHPEFAFVIDQDSYGAATPGEGFWIDDIAATDIYEGAEVWSEIMTTSLLDPGDSQMLNYTWNTTEYCDYIITAEVVLDCDMDPANNVDTATTRIWKLIYPSDEWEKWETEDNTWCEPTEWHIVEECSMCPDNNFWWNGVEEDEDGPVGTYTADRNDCLIVNQTFNMSTATVMYINYSSNYYLEDGYDYGYVEVSNDSGFNQHNSTAGTWMILDQFDGDTGGNWTQESLAIIPGFTILTSPYTGLQFVTLGSFFTDQMHVRFRFYSDGATEERGWFIDNVNISFVNGTGVQYVFFDDMENTTASADLWLDKYMWYGNHWHEEDTFGVPYPNPPFAFWNGEPRSWIGAGVIYYWEYDPSGTGFWGAEWSSVGDWGWWFGVNNERAWGFGGAVGPVNDFLNTTVDLSAAAAPVSCDIRLDYAVYAGPYWVTVTNGILTENHAFTFSTLDGHNLGGNETFTFDLSSFAGDPATTIAIHVNHTAGGTESLSIWYMWINSTGPILPTNLYYANVDEKLILYYDLTHAYEAFFEWDQNFSFANDDDLGYVEIWTGTDWKTLMVVKGAAPAWAHSKLDISSYVGGSELTKIRFRFVSDDALEDYGWLVDDPMVQGKIDYINPTAACAIDPATPDGCCGWYKSPVTLSVTASDNVNVETIYYRIDGGTWKTYTGPVTVNVDGEHTFEAYAEDVVGNPSEICMESFKIDSTPPTSSITFPQSGYIYVGGRELFANPLGGTIIIGGITFGATASDAMSGVDYVTFAVDGMTYEKATTPYEIFWHSFDLLPASYTLTVSAYDEACNKGSDSTLSFTHWL